MQDARDVNDRPRVGGQASLSSVRLTSPDRAVADPAVADRVLAGVLSQLVFGGPVQIAYAVDDTRAAARRWLAEGVGPFFFLDHIELNNSWIRGKPAPFDHSSAYAQWGPVMLELICQHDGGINPIVGTSGVHHVAHFVDDFAAATARLSSSGAVECLYAETANGMPFALHDVRAEQGHLIEIYERTSRLTGFYDMVHDASVNWDGSDPLRNL